MPTSPTPQHHARSVVATALRSFLRRAGGRMLLSALLLSGAPALAALDAPVSPTPLPAVTQLMQFLDGIEGELILSGQQEIAWDQNRYEEDINYVFQQTGKRPVVRGFDFLNYTYSASVRAGQTATARAIDWHAQGGVVTFCCHFFTDIGAPASGPAFYTPGANGNPSGTTFDIRQAVIAGTPENTEFLAKLDVLAAELKVLRDAGVPVIWRPFHEAGGTWFWWSAHGPAPFIQAYRLMFDRFTRLHGLTNLIWVFNPIDSAGTMQTWYPGDDVVDMISLDTYPAAGSNPAYATESQQMRDFRSGRKLVAMSETGSIPEPTQFFSQAALWSYFCTWNGFENDTTRNSVSLLQSVYRHPRVLTLDEFPDAFAGKPVLVTTPAATSANVGQSATFTVEAFGSGLTYQWRRNGAALTGAQAATLSLPAVQLADAGDYDVVVTSAAGSTTSVPVALTVQEIPAFVAAPVNQTVTTGFAVSFVAQLSGTPAPTVRWQVSTNGSTWSNVTDGGVYSGATSDTLTITGAPTSMNGYRYRCVATNAAGSETSAPATLEVILARLLAPNGVALGRGNQLLVTDGSNNTLQQVSADLALSLVAGHAGQQGSTDGTGTAALFRQPGGVALGATGTLYLADTGNSLIRRVSTTGEVTTLAGTAANQGHRDGAGTAAWFNAPEAIAVDAAGVAYVADTGNEVIRRIAADGEVTTLAGTPGTKGHTDGTGASARFNHPGGLALSADGATLYVSDTLNHTIRSVDTATGAVVTLAGVPGISGDSDGAAASALLNTPRGLALDPAGTLLIADTGNSTIRRLTAGGVVDTLAGLAGVAGLTDARGDAAWFNQPRGLAVAADGTVYVADTGNAALRRITTDGAVTTLALLSGPQFTTQPADRSVTAGTAAQFSAAANAAPAPTYRWQRQASGGTTWSDLADGGSYRGAATATLTVSNTTVAMSGERFRCVATNSVESVASESALLTVTASTTPGGGSNGGGSSGGGGGGGAPSLWFLAALAALGLVRRLRHS